MLNMISGAMPKIRKWIPSLREQNAPICLIASLLVKGSNVNPQIGMTVVNQDLLNQSIETMIAKDTIVDKAVIDSRMADIKPLMTSLEEKGVQFVFFEMPVNKRVANLRRFEQTKNAVKEAFPPSRYLYLPNDTASYMTTDGQHLDYGGQQQFSHYFKTVLTEKRLIH